MSKYYLAQVDIIGGLRTEVPVCLSRQSKYNKNVYTDSSDNPFFRIDIKKSNLQKRLGGDIRFWSKSKKDVENFILGVKAANTAMSELTKSKLNV